MSTYLVSWKVSPVTMSANYVTVIRTYKSFAEALDKYRSVKRDPYNSVVKLSHQLEINGE
jgi:hypothetical protein